jgi:hypothetical protein
MAGVRHVPYYEISTDVLFEHFLQRQTDFKQISTGNYRLNPIPVTLVQPDLHFYPAYRLSQHRRPTIPLLWRQQFSSLSQNLECVVVPPEGFSLEFMPGDTLFHCHIKSLAPAPESTFPFRRPVPMTKFYKIDSPHPLQLSRFVVTPVVHLTTIYEYWPCYQRSQLEFSVSDQHFLHWQKDERYVTDLYGHTVDHPCVTHSPTITEYLDYCDTHCCLTTTSVSGLRQS